MRKPASVVPVRTGDVIADEPDKAAPRSQGAVSTAGRRGPRRANEKLGVSSRNARPPMRSGSLSASRSSTGCCEALLRRRRRYVARMVTSPTPPAAFVHVAVAPRVVVPPQPNVLVVAVTNADHAYAPAGCENGAILAVATGAAAEHAITSWVDAGVGLTTPLISCTVTVALSV